jgi:23S rRNA-/tRNA-specific pseudouridylate synthase
VTNRGYYAIVEGMDIPDEGTLKDYLAQDSTFQVYVVRNPSPKASLAITHYKKITAKAGYSFRCPSGDRAQEPNPGPARQHRPLRDWR